MTNSAQLRRHGLFDARVPRYTSYPAANHFSEAVGADQTRRWLADISKTASVSLYVHIPFCSRLCWFCACRTQGTKTARPLLGYLEGLKQEIRVVRSMIGHDITLSRLHLGGGTPTILPPSMLLDLIGAIDAAFPRHPDAEFSVEIDPTDVDTARPDILAEQGMTRASIGVQDFDAKVQAAIGREQSYELTQTVVSDLRARGIQSLNMDILYGLPFQNHERLNRSVAQVISLSPDRVALYGYAHVPWMAKRQIMIPADELPDAQTRLRLFESAAARFDAAGYDRIGIDHFARPGDGLARALSGGRLRRNFQGYTDDAADVLLGIGASAISRYPQGYAQNASATARYAASVANGNLATARGHQFSRDDQSTARLIEQLMCDFSVNAELIANVSATEMSGISGRLAELKAKFPDALEWTEGRLVIAAESRPLTRLIAAELDRYTTTKLSHSLAI
jgi:oxygen-independent coproporphyrinogen-3 oxidase